MNSLLLLLAISISVNTVFTSPSTLNLTIIHNNDIHARFVPSDVYGNDCESAEEVGCYGGIARTVYKVKELKKQIPNLLFLNAGDNYVGTLWYTLFKWRLVSVVVRQMNFDAMTFGNHEFDDGVPGLAPYVNETAPFIPTLACNLDVSGEPRFKDLVQKSKIFEIDERKIAVIGYITPETAEISSPGPTLKFTDEIECIREEVERLKKQNVNIFIALGHSGFDVDREIARQVPDIDIVVGGHSNTFLYTGKQPSDEVPVDDYPVVIEHTDGRKSLVVQAFAFSKYLGFLNVLIDEKGDVKQFSGQPILLDHTIPEDTEVRDVLAPKAAEINEKYDTPIGNTSVLLDGDCRRHECNLGNLVTDAMVKIVLINSERKGKKGWTEYPCALISGGAIRASIDEISTDGYVTLRDIFRVFPFLDRIVGVVLPGKVLKDVFEHSVFRFNPNAKAFAGEYLQVSGFRVKYDLSKNVGERVQQLEVRCGDCRVPTYEPFDESKTYKVITSRYISEGGDLYSMMKIVEHIPLMDSLQDSVREYITQYSPIASGVESRTSFVSDRRGKALDGKSSAADRLTHNIYVTIMLKLIFIFIQMC